MNPKSFKDQIVKLRTAGTPNSAKTIFLIIFCSSLLLLFLTDLTIKSKPPKRSYYLDTEFNKSSPKSELLTTLSWHLKNNLGSLISEEAACSIWLASEDKEKRNFQLDCPILDLHTQGTLDKIKLDTIKTSFTNNLDFWNNINNSQANKTAYLSPFKLKILETEVIKISNGLLGKEITIKIEFEVEGLSDSYKNLIKILESKAHPITVNEKSYFGKILTNTVVFRNNRYGYYLPILPVLK